MEEDENSTLEGNSPVKYTKAYTYRYNDPANDLVRCYETSRIRINTDFMCSLLKFAIFGALLAVIAGAIGNMLGGIAGALVIVCLILILLIWLYIIISSSKTQRKQLDAEEVEELRSLDNEE
ncbi:MAG TPA: hypothetical protein O0X50_04405 [Methanocorpusculum sp.]|nr:hypothetical protein [Methanocorpusculum sp.]